jgi:hypothetical protein
MQYTSSTAAGHHGTPHIGFIKFFVRATSMAGDVKRLAVCQLFKATISGEMLRVNMTRPLAEDVMLEIDQLGGKLVTARSEDHLYGMAYRNTSGMA